MSKEKKVSIFIRKDCRNGIYSTRFHGEEVRITNNEMFTTDDSKLIKFMKCDPELSEYISEVEDDEVIEYNAMKKEDLLKIAEKRNIDCKDLNKDDIVLKLLDDDILNSDPSNDPGEQK